MSEASLPEELLRDILSILLSVHEDHFCAWPTFDRPRWKTPPNRHIRRTSDDSGILLVSKRWRRIGTPLLYEKLYLWDTKGTKTVAQVIKSDPGLGKTVRYLRLEGGMGRDLHTIIKHAPNIHTLWITPCVRASEGISGLKKSLTLLNPRKLYVFAMQSRSNKAAVEAEQLLLSCIEISWTTLVSHPFLNVILHTPRLLTNLHVPQTSISLHHSTIMTPELAHTLSKAPMLKNLHVRSSFRFQYWIKEGYIATIGKSRTLEEICVAGNSRIVEIMEDARLLLPERVVQMIKVIETESDRRWSAQYFPCCCHTLLTLC